MRTRNPIEKQPRVAKQLGVQVNIAQWRRFRLLAFKRGQTAGSLLKEVLEGYLEKHENGEKQ